MTRPFFRYGWHPPETFGAYHLGTFRAARGALDSLPLRVRLAHVPAEVYDQGQTGSCTAQALAIAVRAAQGFCGYPDSAPSRPDIYYRERLREGTVTSDQGAMLADGIDAVRDGWIPESEWGFLPTWGARWTARPPALAPDSPRVVNAEDLVIEPETLAWELASGHPIVVGLRVTEAWETLSGGTLPETDGNSIGGHAVAIVGYDRESRHFRVRNSWGESWGDGGEAWLPWDWIRVGPCGEAFAIRVVRCV